MDGVNEFEFYYLVCRVTFDTGIVEWYLGVNTEGGNNL